MATRSPTLSLSNHRSCCPRTLRPSRHQGIIKYFLVISFGDNNNKIVFSDNSAGQDPDLCARIMMALCMDKRASHKQVCLYSLIIRLARARSLHRALVGEVSVGAHHFSQRGHLITVWRVKK